MTLSYEVDRFSKLSGEDGKHTSIGRIGAFLDGYTTALGSIEAEPVIRCKDCRYSNTSLVSDRIVCVYFDDAIYGMQENDFCSRAERKENGSDL